MRLKITDHRSLLPSPCFDNKPDNTSSRTRGNFTLVNFILIPRFNLWVNIHLIQTTFILLEELPIYELSSLMSSLQSDPWRLPWSPLDFLLNSNRWRLPNWTLLCSSTLAQPIMIRRHQPIQFLVMTIVLLLPFTAAWPWPPSVGNREGLIYRRQDNSNTESGVWRIILLTLDFVLRPRRIYGLFLISTDKDSDR